MKDATLRATVNTEMLADYMTADFGGWLAVFPDGSWDICDGAPVSAVAAVKCPGIGNIDASALVEGWASKDPETGEYVVTGSLHDDRGREVGDLETTIREVCRDGDMTAYLEDLKEALVASFEEN